LGSAALGAKLAGMDLASFKESVAQDAPPDGLATPAQALWRLRKGDWKEAHRLAQLDEEEQVSCWVHAHLHRVEGDLSNAGYWYRKAGKPVAKSSLESEWDEIAAAILG
jgi:hypothetical protein